MKFFGFIFFVTFTLSQTWDNHPELDWKSFETENFIFYFHDGTQRSALEASKVAEIIYDPITSLYDFYPKSKTAVILKDTDDYSNGVAMFYDNKIEIWTKPMDFDLRGNHRWIQDVLTHEFVHIVQLGASKKFSDNLPAVYLQIIDYEDERREDVLYGYPNRIISVPVPGTSVPPWFAEGVAQYMYNDVYYDFWDSHRDMVLRDAVLNDNLLTYNEMSTFGKKGIGNENVYNQGFALVNFIVSQYGEKSLKNITNQISMPNIYTFDKAFKNATGDNIEQVFVNFKDSLNVKYSSYSNKKNENMIFLETEGTANINPIWSKDSNKILFLSNKSSDFFSKTDLYVYDLNENKSEKIVSGVKGTASWINDTLVVYSKISLPDKNGSKFFDIYQYNLKSEKEDRLTFGARLYSPSYNVQENKIIAVNQYDGTSNIVISEFSDTLIFKAITKYDNGFQIFNADWLDSNIVFDAVSIHGRDIYTISQSGDKVEIIQGDYYDERDPFYSQNSNQLIWSEDRGAVFNLYGQDLNNKKLYQITDVSGGAFYPSVSFNGKLAFSVFENGGYKLAYLDSFIDIEQNFNITNSDWDSFLEGSYAKTNNIVQSEISQINNYQDYDVEKMNTLILPRLFIDYGYIKPGFYMMSTDVLQKLSVFAGGGLNRKKDLDLFLMFENYNYSFTPYVNVFWVTRNKRTSAFYSDQAGQEYQNMPIINDYLFNLFSLDVGTRFSVISDSKKVPGRHKFWINYQYNNYREKVEQTINQYNQSGEIDFYDNFDFSFDYYRSHIVYFEYRYKKQKNHFMKSMFPTNGFDIRFKLSYEFNDFLNGFGIYEDSGTFGSILSPNNTTRFELDFNKVWLFNKDRANKVSLLSKTSLGYISKENIDDFFYFFGGGMPGLKGFTYYNESLKGSRKILQSFYIRTPIFKESSIPFVSSYFKHMTVGLIIQAGNVYNGDKLKIENFKTSNGFEFRLFGYNVYSYPLAITYEYHIGENQSDGRHYFKLLFDFD